MLPTRLQVLLCDQIYDSWIPSMQDCNFLDVPVSQSDHNQLRGLPNLQRIVVLDRGGELK